MGKIPRKLKTINGFVNCKFGLLPYEDNDDKLKLIALAEIYDKAIDAKRIIHTSAGPSYGKVIKTEEAKAMALIKSHAEKNILLINRKIRIYKLAEQLMKKKRWFIFERKYVEF